MKVLLHICCAPCTIYPLKVLRAEGFEVMGLFLNPNIHPYQEYLRRKSTLEDYSRKEGFRVIYEEGYNLEEFLRGVVFRESNRCVYCYHSRLKGAVIIARRGRFNYFTTTLLYSKFQRHETIRSIGESLGKEYGVPFLYRDFRDGWKEGIAISKELNMYRQEYCGCIYSEKERYFRSSKRQESG